MSSPERIACVDLPAFPLQLVLREHPGWRDEPTVVVEDDRPHAPILWLNRPARGLAIRRGMKFAQARSLSGTLRAAVVSEVQIRAGIDDLLKHLLHFSPRVEPVRELPGLFWIDPNGLEHIYPKLGHWAQEVFESLKELNFSTSVVVGFRRLSVLAVARTRLGACLLDDDEREAAEARRVELRRLTLQPELCEAMQRLGIETLGDFLRLPYGSLRQRYGIEAAALYEAATGRCFEPLRSELPDVPVRTEVPLEPATVDLARMLFAVKAALHRLVGVLADRCEAVVALSLTLHLEHAGDLAERLETAAATLDVMQLLELLRLRLSARSFLAPVQQIDIEVERVVVRPEQVPLLFNRPRRDLEAAQRALARLEASFGRHAVTRPRLRDAYLPEARFCWEPVGEMRLPQPIDVDGAIPLIREMLPAPIRLAARPKHEPEAWLRSYGIIHRMFGPLRISGGWWVRRVERDYYFVEMKSGRILWLFYDRGRRMWRMHGGVE